MMFLLRGEKKNQSRDRKNKRGEKKVKYQLKFCNEPREKHIDF